MQGGGWVPNVTNYETQALVSLNASNQWCTVGRRGQPIDQASAASSWLRLGFSKCYTVYEDLDARRRCFGSVIPIAKCETAGIM